MIIFICLFGAVDFDFRFLRNGCPINRIRFAVKIITVIVHGHKRITARTDIQILDDKGNLVAGSGKAADRHAQ